MSLYFLINNFHFAIELMGAIVFLMAAWLTFDTYSVRKDFETLCRAIGFSFAAVAQTAFALNSGSDLLSYFGYLLLALGLVLIVGSFLKQQQLQVQAVVVIPAFSQWSSYLYAIVAVLFCAVAYLSFKRSRQEFNKTWTPFSLAFLLLGIASACAILGKGSQTSMIVIAGYVIESVGFILLARWVWQFLQLRIRESIILIFISVALFLSTLVTLAFSTILINQITSQTEANLLTDARVLGLDIESLKEQSRVKAAHIALDEDLRGAIAGNDFGRLGQISEALLETYQLGFLTIIDPQGSVLVRAHTLSRRGDTLLGERTVEEALQGNVFVTVEDSPVEKLSIRAGAPIIVNRETIGVVIAGYPLDNALVDSIKRLTGLEMFIYQGDTSTASTALASDGRTRLIGVSLTNAEVKKAVLTDGTSATAQAEFYGQPYLASYLPLINGDSKIIGMISAAKPQQDILDIANSTNRLTLITVILIMLALAYPIYSFTRRLTEEG